MSRSRVLITCLSLMLLGCPTYKPVTFLQFNDVEIIAIENGKIIMSAQAIFSNPNTIKGKIKNVDIHVLYKEDTLAKVEQVEKFSLPPTNNFSLPLFLTISIDKFQEGLLSNLPLLFKMSTIDLVFVGDIKVAHYGLTQKIKVYYSETITF